MVYTTATIAAPVAITATINATPLIVSIPQILKKNACFGWNNERISVLEKCFNSLALPLNTIA